MSVDFAALANLKNGQLFGSLSITASRARELILAVDAEAIASLADATRPYLDAVLCEVNSLRHAIHDDAAFVTRRAACFGAATPNRTLKQSIGMGRYFADTLDFGAATLATLELAILSGYVDVDGRKGTPLPQQYVRSLADLAPHLAAGRLPARDALADCFGISHKVASMMTAIVEPDRNIWTVDRHHLRQLLAMAGSDPYVKNIGYGTTEAYSLIEGFFLAYAGQHFPGVPVWAVQWATWNVAFGDHQPHAAIWAA